MTRSSRWSQYKNRQRKLPGDELTRQLTLPVLEIRGASIPYCRTFVGAGKGGGEEASDTGGMVTSAGAVAAGAGTPIGPAAAGTGGAFTGTGSSLGTGRLTRADVSEDGAGLTPSATAVPAVRLFMLDMFGVREAAGPAGCVSDAGTGVGGARLFGAAGGIGGLIGLVCEVGVASATAVGAGAFGVAWFCLAMALAVDGH
jgi:hypothetical protein